MSPTANPHLAADVGEFPAEADALLDRLEITCELHLEGAGSPEERAAAWSRLAAGVLGPRGNVGFRWRCPRSAADLELGGRLVPATSGVQCVAKSASVLRLNPLLWLRRQVAHDCGTALDGNDNVVGPPEADRPHLLGLQLLTVADVVDTFVGECSRAAGRRLLPRLFVRSAEVNRDLVRPSSPAVARRIAGAPGHWFRRLGVVHHPAARGLEAFGDLAVATWWNDREDAPVRYKFYAKTEGLLRVELVLDNRRAVELVGWGGSTPGPAASGSELAGRLRRLAEATAPALADMEAHVAGFVAPDLGTLDLLAALAPLLQLAAPPPRSRAGGRPAVRTQGHARTAIEMLLTTGRFDASQVPANSQVRKKLREMAGYGALLHAPRGRARIFALPAALQSARAPLAAALIPTVPRAVQDRR